MYSVVVVGFVVVGVVVVVGALDGKVKVLSSVGVGVMVSVSAN